MFFPLLTTFIILLGIYFACRSVDIRLVLGICALFIFLLVHQPFQYFIFLAQEMANEKTIVPICSAMGFAHVVKLTGCDRHLVHLFLKPIRSVRWLLIPGGILACYLVNTTVVSQSSTAVTVSAVLIPLLQAAGLSPVVSGSVLLLGSSIGGELFNPGAVEIITLSNLTGLASTEVVRRIIPINVTTSLTVLLTFWGCSIFQSPRAQREPDAALIKAVEPFRVKVYQAMVPFFPIFFLFLAPHFLKIPAEISNSRMILIAMVLGIFIAGLTSPRSLKDIFKSFFEGAGYGYTHVISLIVTATVFVEAVKSSGLIEFLIQWIAHSASLVFSASIFSSWGFAVLTGSGIAPAVGIMKILIPAANQFHVEAIKLGVVISIAAHLGRTMSPAAAVMMVSATVSKASIPELIKKISIPIASALIMLLIITLLGVL